MGTSRTAASWPLAPHTGAKLALLSAYLSAWFPILSSTSPQRVFYIDGFAGPGRYSGGEDGSPVVALKALGLRGNLAKTTFEFHLLPVLKGLAVGSVGHSAANRKNLSFG